MLSNIIDYFKQFSTRTTLGLCGVCAVVLILGKVTTTVLESKAVAQDGGGTIEVWTYESGYFLTHPKDPRLMCIATVGAPGGTQLHCAPLQPARGDTI